MDRSESFYRAHFGGEVIDRGDAADGTGAAAVNHITLEIADKLLYFFDEAP